MTEVQTGIGDTPGVSTFGGPKPNRQAVYDELKK
jgi:hypothetical protein